MSNLKNSIGLNDEQFKQLALETLEVNGETKEYDDNNLYMVPSKDAKDYDASAIYNSGDIVCYGGNVYTPITDFVSGVVPTDTSKWKSLINLLDKIYPVGSIYMSISETDPGLLFGGTWEKIEGRFLLSASSEYTAGSEGGSAEHTLTIDEMPSHKHQLESGVGVDWSDQGATTSPISFLSEISNGRNIDSKAVGGGLPHNNMPPYLAVYMWKRISDEEVTE